MWWLSRTTPQIIISVHQLAFQSVFSSCFFGVSLVNFACPDDRRRFRRGEIQTLAFSIPGGYLYPMGRFGFVAAFGVVGAIIAGFAWCPFSHQRPQEYAYLTHVRVFVENSPACVRGVEAASCGATTRKHALAFFASSLLNCCLVKGGTFSLFSVWR